MHFISCLDVTANAVAVSLTLQRLHFRPRIFRFRRRSLVGRQRSERQRERESKWRTQSEANPRYYRGLAVRNNVNHTLSSAWEVSLETPDVNALSLPMTATSLIKDSEIVPMILQLLSLRLSADISLVVPPLSQHPALAGRPTSYCFRKRWTLISHTRSLKRALQIRWQLVAANGNDREGAT